MRWVGLCAGLPRVTVDAANPEIGDGDDVFGLGWDALIAAAEIRRGGKAVVNHTLIDSWVREKAPILLDFGAGPRLGEAVVQLPGVKRLRVQRRAGPCVVVSGNYGAWGTRASLQGARVSGLVGRIPRGPGARNVFSKFLHDLGPDRPGALARQLDAAVTEPWECEVMKQKGVSRFDVSGCDDWRVWTTAEGAVREALRHATPTISATGSSGKRCRLG